MTIDIHAHITTDLPKRLAEDRAIGIDTTILMSTRVHPEKARTLADIRAEFDALRQVVAGDPGVGSYQAAADELSAAVSGTAGRVAAMAAAPLWLPTTDLVELVDRQLAHPAFVGIGELTPPAGAAHMIAPMVELAADHDGLPILAHGFAPNTDSDLRDYAEHASRHPRVPVIIGAFGGLHSMLAVELAHDISNIYLDLSSALQAVIVRAAAHEVPDKCLFGSNTPYGVPAATLATVNHVVRDPHIRQAILHDNAARLFGLN